MILGSLVGSDWMGGELVPDINTSDGSDDICEYATGDVALVDKAIAAPRDALATQLRLPQLQRHSVLSSVSREEGTTLAGGVGEIGCAAQTLEFLAGKALQLSGETGASTREGEQVSVTREPLGVVGVVRPWKFQVPIPAWKIAPALASGNMVLCKLASLVPASAHAPAETLHRAGTPVGATNLVTASRSTVGKAPTDGDVVAISFTGSVTTDDADLKHAVSCAVDGAWFAPAQRIAASSRLVVNEDNHNRFAAARKQREAGLRVGDALKATTQIGPAVDASQLGSSSPNMDAGAALEIGGEAIELRTREFFQSPAIFTGVTNETSIGRERIFYPVAAVIRVRGYDEAPVVANDTPFCLWPTFRRRPQAGKYGESSNRRRRLPCAVRRHKGSSFSPCEQGSYAPEFYTTVKAALCLRRLTSAPAK